jgi:putative Holliday junction resolvase
MRILGLDLGAKRIGLAISDPETGIALPSGILESHGRAKDLSALCELIAAREVKRAVVGLPIHMNGSLGPEAQKAKEFASALSDASGIPVDTLDERWTSQEAMRLGDLADAGRDSHLRAGKGRAKQRSRRRKPGARIDDLAATLILRTYLERRRNRGEA